MKNDHDYGCRSFRIGHPGFPGVALTVMMAMPGIHADVRGDTTSVIRDQDRPGAGETDRDLLIDLQGTVDVILDREH